MAYVIGLPVTYGPMDGIDENELRERFAQRADFGDLVIFEAKDIAKRLSEIVPAPVLRAWATYHVQPIIMDAKLTSAEKNKLATALQDALQAVE